MTVTEAAQLLGRDTRTVRYWIGKELIRVRRSPHSGRSRMEIPHESFFAFAHGMGYTDRELADLREQLSAMPEKPRRERRTKVQEDAIDGDVLLIEERP